jgi:death-on-curing protein
MRWIWVREDVVIAVQSEQLRAHGGSSGIRDKGLLQSALARPPDLAAYGDPDISALAARYAHAIISNHPFVDGNKRTAYVVCELFLALNGQILSAGDAEAAMTFLDLADGRLSEDQLADWIRTNTRPA